MGQGLCCCFPNCAKEGEINSAVSSSIGIDSLMALKLEDHALIINNIATAVTNDQTKSKCWGRKNLVARFQLASGKKNLCSQVHILVVKTTPSAKVTFR